MRESTNALPSARKANSRKIAFSSTFKVSAIRQHHAAIKSLTHFTTSTLLVLPVVDPFVFPKSLHQKQRYTILCSVSKGDMPLEIKWYKDGKHIKVPDFPGINVIHVSQFSTSLVFESLRPEHRGNYSCEATNGAGSVSYNSSMTVHGKISALPFRVSISQSASQFHQSGQWSRQTPMLLKDERRSSTAKPTAFHLRAFDGQRPKPDSTSRRPSSSPSFQVRTCEFSRTVHWRFTMPRSPTRLPTYVKQATASAED